MVYGSTNQAGANVSNNVVGVVRDIDMVVHRLAKVVQHLDVIGDRIEGTRPAEAGCGEPDTPAHSTINEMQRTHARLSALATMLENAAVRIDNAIGGGSELKQSGGSPSRTA